MTDRYDVVIIGGGLVGGVLAISLAQTSTLHIAVVDHLPESAYEYSHATRVSAITQTSKLFLSTLMIWEKIINSAISPCLNIILQDGSSQIHFSEQDTSFPELMTIVENQAILNAVFETKNRYSNIHWFFKEKSKVLRRNSNDIEIQLESGEILISDLLIGADGKSSWVREQSGIQLNILKNEDMAVVANITHAHPHENTAKQIFLETGTLATLPLHDAQSSNLIWSLPKTIAKDVFSMEKQGFLTQFNQQSALISAVDVSTRSIFPVPTQVASHYVADRVALVGDAAHGVHPMAGQGVNLGWKDVMTLSLLIAQAHQKKEPIFSKRLLRKYERTRKAENSWMVNGIRGLDYVFRQSPFWIRAPRRFGFRAIESHSWLKRWLIQFANG